MVDPDRKLDEIARCLRAGEGIDPITVRDFIGWWYAERRSSWTVWRIRRALEKASLRTTPDFQSTYLDAEIEFALDVEIEPEGDIDLEIDTDSPLPVEDPTYRISKLKAANQGVISVNPEASLDAAIIVMMENDLSQIPVMPNERDVKGMITWQSIGTRLALNPPVRQARFFMDKAQISSSSESIFEIIDLVVRYDYTLVRGDDNKITGIITASDLNIQFRQLSEAFLILSEIENTLRILVESRFTAPELSACRDNEDSSRVVQGAADLTFGEFVRLLENPERWKQFGVAIDRSRFCESLNRVRTIRNDVMHFDPDGIPDKDLRKLQDFSRFLRKILHIVN